MSNWQIAAENPLARLAPYKSDEVWLRPVNGAAAHTKGPWLQAAASTPYDSGCLYIAINNDLDTSGERWFVDIAVGAAGSEQVVVSNLPIVNGSYKGPVTALFLPLAIPRGSRISVRSQSSESPARSLYMYVGIQAAHPLGLAPYTRCTTLGASEATTTYPAVAVRYGTPTYTELVSATAMRAGAVVLLTCGTTTSGYLRTQVTLATGAAGAEVPLLDGLMVARLGPGFSTQPATIGPIRCPIAAGARLSLGAVSESTSGDLRLGALLLS